MIKMNLNKSLKGVLFLSIFNIFVIIHSKPVYVETENECDNDDDGKNPILLSRNAQKSSTNLHPISLDSEDITDRQDFNVHHEEVHGTILMPRVKFELNNDDDYVRSEDDYNDYANIVGGVKTSHFGRRSKTLKRFESWHPINQKPRYPTSVMNLNSPVRRYPDLSQNPTIEEMIPYTKIKNTPDTYVVMVDDPVIVVDSIAKCHSQSTSSTETTKPNNSLSEESTETVTKSITTTEESPSTKTLVVYKKKGSVSSSITSTISKVGAVGSSDIEKPERGRRTSH